LLKFNPVIYYLNKEKIMPFGRQLLVAVAATSLLTLSPLHAEQTDQHKLQVEAINIIKQFGGTLKPELKKAIQSSGPAHAIDVCSLKAPAIAEGLQAQTGWYVKRVSLKNRNENAVPDSWEKKVLEQFDARQAKGESPRNMAYSEIVDGKYRFMKAQAVGKLCLNCHGTNVTPEVEAALKEKYPNDHARGYSLGQIRGAFSLAKDL
jgi:hypothetical protein